MLLISQSGSCCVLCVWIDKWYGAILSNTYSDDAEKAAGLGGHNIISNVAYSGQKDIMDHISVLNIQGKIL